SGVETLGPMKKQTSKLKLPGKFDPQTRWAIGYFLITLLVLWVWQELISEFAVRTIPYSQFKVHLARREVVEAAVKQEEIVGRVVPLAAREPNAAPAEPVLTTPKTNAVPLALRRALAETRPFLFRTVRIEDPDLVKELQSAGVEYSAVRPPFLSQFLLAWVLPVAVMIGLWTFIGRRFGAAGESILSFGKSRARLIVDKNTGATLDDEAGRDEAKFAVKEVVD